MKWRTGILTFLSTLLASCAYTNETSAQTQPSSPFAKFDDFVCRHAPAYSNNGEENFILYNYAKYTELHARFPRQDVWAEVLPYLRLAAANGDTLANIRLQTYLLKRKIPAELAPKKISTEVLDLNDKLLAQELPIAYYRKSQYISMGLYRGGVMEAGAYLRRAAYMGDKDAQTAIGNLIEFQMDIPPEERFPYVLKFLGCAAEQGHAESAANLAVWITTPKYVWINEQHNGLDRFNANMRYLHLGAKGVTIGDTNRALSKLRRGFTLTAPNVREDYFNLAEPDLERARRYEILLDYSFNYSYLNPSVPELDEIVPLPPAKLPKWDGTTAFQRWYEGPPPPKPSAELINRLAKQYGLDPKTGLPLQQR